MYIISIQVIDQMFDQLDEENSGHISSIKLLSIIKSLEDSNSSGLMSQLGTDCEPCGVFSSSPPICSEYENHQNKDLLISNPNTSLFSTVDPQNTGFASFSSLVNYFVGIGIEDGCQVLTTLLSDGPQSKIDLVALSKQMIEDLFDNVDNVLTARASLSCLLRELVHVKTGLECAVSERERLRSDLTVSNLSLTNQMHTRSTNLSVFPSDDVSI